MDESKWKSIEAASVPVGLCNLKSFKMAFIFSESSSFSSFYIVSQSDQLTSHNSNLTPRNPQF